MSQIPSNRRPIHPGEILAKEFIEPYGISQSELAIHLHMPFQRINQIINGHRSVTPDTAIRLSRYFETSAEFWLNLQQNFDLYLALHSNKKGTVFQIEPIKKSRVLHRA